MEHLNDSLFSLVGNLHVHLDFLAYSNIKDPDILAQMQGAWNHFVKTGQVWAMLVGVIIGYMFKSLTSYG
jgi:muramidase (phage lysozyme)